ncbi:head completion/stabilization protein [Photobacterium sp. TY1-4]|uniref:head completion/stabilization protein n=1 Tax=Photobacterium sp. TY1-4 TaxID=2899122 RepID=UPI0021BF05D0|nr:head completion/stabilization protein [Photobacterium sp. TY1-4]UXI00438.1 head completion/stabilization protein [Photobacterium sp. TY1-4]
MFSPNASTGYQDTVINNDGFWPDINAGDFERRRGTPADQDDENIAYALVAAIAEVNRQLSDQKLKYQEGGVQSASELTSSPSIGGKNAVVIQYERAVFARAKADLLPDFATVHQRNAGNNLAERSAETRSELLAESQRIIRNMCGLNRSTVTLI